MRIRETHKVELIMAALNHRNEGTKRLGSFMFWLFLILLFIGQKGLRAQMLTEDKIKAQYIYFFSKNVQWENEAQIDTFRIGVIGNGFIYNELINITSTNKHKSKPFQLYNYILPPGQNPKVQIIFLAKERNSELQRVAELLKGTQTLLVTDQAKEVTFTMINFKKIEKSAKHYEINYQTMSAEKMQATQKLLAQGGDEVILREIFNEQTRQLEGLTDQLDQMQESYEKQLKEFEKQKKEIAKQTALITNQKSEIANQESKIDGQKGELFSLISQADLQEKNLLEKTNVLSTQEQSIKEKMQLLDSQNRLMQAGNTKLGQLNQEISTKEKKISTQSQSLLEKNITIETQRNILYIVLGFLAAIGLLAYVVFLALRKNRRYAKQLNRQKEEITLQARELEKLSIVASETDNAVLIADLNGDFEWVNEGYVRMFGFSLSELVNSVSKNIIGPDTSPEIKAKIAKAVQKGKPISYEFESKTKSGDSIWVYTTLTPIMDDKGQVKKYVIIDSDITIQKLQEVELAKEKETVERQNQHIMSSIRYAQTIQEAILPSRHVVSKFVDFFLIYLPKDIVSGDFYWFSDLSEEAGHQKFVAGCIDCTGHGVPGAFMSVIGSWLLNEIINVQRISNPADIMYRLDNGVKRILKQEETENRDGMELGICLIEQNDQKTSKMDYCGAKRPLFMYEENLGFISIPGNRKAIGGTGAKRNTEVFENTSMIVPSGTYLYLSSDGYMDQNGPGRQRYGTDRFEKLLRNICKLPLDRQKEAILDDLMIFQQDEHQRDDITIIALKLK